MKRKNLALIALVLLFSLSSCKGKSTSSQSSDIDASEVFNYNDYIIDNAKEPESNSYPSYRLPAAQRRFEENTSLGVSVIESYIEHGLLIVANQYNAVGFYSLIHQDYIIQPQYNRVWLKYEVNNLSYLGYIIHVRYQDKSLIVDPNSNILYDGERLPEPLPYLTLSFSTTLIDDVVYLIKTQNSVNTYYVYSRNFKLTQIEKLPTEDNLEVGTILSGERMKLDDYGLTGYTLSYNYGQRIIRVYDPSGKLVSSFSASAGYGPYLKTKSMPEFYLPGALAGHFYYYRNLDEMPVDSEEYDFIAFGDKVKQNLYQVDILTGVTKLIEFDLAIDNMYTVANNNGLLKLLVIEANEINANKSLGVYKRTIYDQSMTQILKDATSESLFQYVKIGDNYFNSDSDIIYDSEFNIIADLSGLSPYLIKDAACFDFEYEENLHGLVDYNGRILVEPRYEKIYRDSYKDGVIIAERLDGAFEKVTIATNTAVVIEGTVNYLTRGVFFQYDAGQLKIFDAAHVLHTIAVNYPPKMPKSSGGVHPIPVVIESVVSARNYHSMITNNDSLFITIEDREGSNKVTTYVTLSVDPVDKTNFNPIGTEKLTAYPTGSFTSPFELHEGENHINLTTIGVDVYLHFKATHNGEYEINVPHTGTIEFSVYDSVSSSYVVLFTNTSTLIQYLNAGGDYMYKISSSPSLYYKVNFKENLL